MADQTVELAFRDSGVKPLTDDVNALADAIDRLPATFTFRAAGRAAAIPSGAPGGMRAPATPARQLAAAASASASTNIRMSVQAVAQASAQGGGGISGLMSAIAGLPPVAKAAAVAVAAVVGSFVHAFRTLRAATTPSFQYGLGSVNASRGAFRNLGIEDPYGRARSFSDAIASNPYGRIAAMRAGINPNNNLFGGDLDDPAKALKWIKRYGDPSLSSRQEAMRADRASGGAYSDEIATLRNASPEMRKRALDQQAMALDPDKLRKAADAQIAYNMAVGAFSDMVTGAVGWLADGWSSGRSALGGPPKQTQDKETASRDKNSQAIDRLTHALDGINGGGSRTRNALPSGWGMEQYRQGVFRDAAALGVI